jgi:hypothetical protein
MRSPAQHVMPVIGLELPLYLRGSRASAISRAPYLEDEELSRQRLRFQHSSLDFLEAGALFSIDTGKDTQDSGSQKILA